MLGIYCLHPNGLPDTGGSGVEATVRMVERALLTGGLLMLTQMVDGTQRDIVIAFCQLIGDVKAEGGVSTAMRAYVLTVHVKLRLVVYCAEMQNNTLACPRCGNFNILAIPDTVHKIGVTDTGKLALGTIRNGDLTVQRVALIELETFAVFGIIDLKIPLTVETDPILTDKLRSGVFFSQINHVSNLL